jgi:hypothetical protein
MPKIVINSEPGGFGLSHDALMLYAKLKKLNMQVYCKSEGEKNVYELYQKKVGRDIYDYLLFHCVLPMGEIFPQKVDSVFLSNHSLQVTDYYFLIQNNGKKLLHDFRSDPCLVQVVQTLEELASDTSANLKVVNVPDDVIWEIWTFGSGSEIVKEVSREWR